MSFRSLLFAPGDKPERFEKALAAGADAVCLDLEDAVALSAKAEAREIVRLFLADRPGAAGARMNAVSSAHAEEDAKALAAARFLMIPKAESAAQLAQARAWAGEIPLWPIVESAEGLKNCWEIAAAPGVAGVLFGGADFSADLGCAMEWEALLYARGRLVAACGRAGVQALDVPHLDIKNEADLQISTARVKAMGYTGRACIHPMQVPVVNAVFTPTEAETARARRVIEAFDAANGAAALLDGKLIELPVIRAARRVLERAGK